MQVADMFATEEKAVRWFEDWTWPTGEMACTMWGRGRCVPSEVVQPDTLSVPGLLAVLLAQD